MHFLYHIDAERYWRNELRAKSPLGAREFGERPWVMLYQAIHPDLSLTQASDWAVDTVGIEHFAYNKDFLPLRLWMAEGKLPEESCATEPLAEFLWSNHKSREELDTAIHTMHRQLEAHLPPEVVDQLLIHIDEKGRPFISPAMGHMLEKPRMKAPGEFERAVSDSMKLSDEDLRKVLMEGGRGAAELAANLATLVEAETEKHAQRQERRKLQTVETKTWKYPPISAEDLAKNSRAVEAVVPSTRIESRGLSHRERHAPEQMKGMDAIRKGNIPWQKASPWERQ
jgi:hypothetical protein